MFAVLKIEEPKKRRIFFKKKQKNSLPRVLTEQVDRTTYFTIVTQKENNSINWGKIFEAAGRESSRLLIPMHLNPPQKSGVKPYKGEKYLQKIIINTAFDLIRRSSVPKEELVLCLYDYYAKYPEIALSMLRHAGTVKVFTASKSIYSSYNIAALNTMGTMFLCSDRPPETSSFHLLLAPFGLCDRPVPPYDSPSIYLGNTASPYTIGTGCISLPDEIERNVPPDIDSSVFAAALYERAHLTYLGEKSAAYLIHNEQKIPVFQIKLS
ncbi:MAG: hypothetical protein BGN88_12745 [Clostridiales bacterium 43-6]|nr:MAG: hypothetical protein BGN88_12745 [Clostridiales bacterium 43-6]